MVFQWITNIGNQFAEVFQALAVLSEVVVAMSAFFLGYLIIKNMVKLDTQIAVVVGAVLSSASFYFISTLLSNPIPIIIVGVSYLGVSIMLSRFLK